MSLQFKVPSMVCEGCAETVTKAIASLDSRAQVTVNLDSKEVVADTSAAMSDVRAVIVDRGHTVE